MAASSKHFVLLDAYSELTDKEAFCLGEANFEGVLMAQAKKSKISDELTRLGNEDPLDKRNKVLFDKAVHELIDREAANDKKIKELIRQNRDEFKGLSKQGRSASKFRRAYGMGDDDRSSSLKDKA